MEQKRHPIRWLIWALAVGFYFYEYILRIEPSVMVQSIMDSFHVDAALVGFLNAAYFYAYAPMQLPVGLLMDRFGPRKLLTLGTLCCGLGGVVFAAVLQFDLAIAARILMGFGSSFAFIGMIYVCSHWFSGKVLALLIGIGNSLGMAGAMWGEALLGYLVDTFGWRLVTMILGAVGILLALCIFALFKLYPGPPSHAKDRAEHLSTVWTNLKVVLSNWQTWLCALVSLLMYLTTVTFAGLWGASFLETAHGYSVEEAGVSMSMIFLGWMVGGPITGFLGDRGLDRKWVIMGSSLIAGLLMLPVIYNLSISPVAMIVLLFSVGLFSSAQLLTYSYSIMINPEKGKGTAAAFTNFMVMIAGSTAQPLVGYLLDLRAEWIHEGTTRLITAQDLQVALTLFPLSFFLAFLLSFFLRHRTKLSLPA